MKTYRLITHILAIATATLSLSSCDDESFLEETPETFYTTSNIYSGQAQVSQVLASCYSAYRMIYCPPGWWDSLLGNSQMLCLYSIGNGTDMFDVATIRKELRMNDYSILSAQSDIFSAVYDSYYKLISMANQAIEAANMEGMTWDDEEARAYAIAQGRFFRAVAYRNLGELFGGVPLVTETATSPRYDYVRATRLETYQYAIDELEAILSDVPESADAGYIVRAAVQHNLANLYIDKGLVQEKEGGDASASYQKGVDYADAVIDGGRYHLMTERFGTRASEDPEYYYANSPSGQTEDHTYTAAGHHIDGNVYWDLFQEGNQDYQDGNMEAIWVSQSSEALHRANTSYGWSALCLFYPGFYGPVFRDSGGEYVGGALEDVGGLGMVLACPTFYTRDIIYEGKWADDMRNSEAALRRTFLGNIPGTEYYGKPVPWDLLYGHDTGTIDQQKETELFPISVKIASDNIPDNLDGTKTAIFRDEYLIRLPETILLRAEAHMRMGDLSAAADDINMLRSRAQCGYMVTASDVDVELLLDERARELVYEEHRWNTLLRMGGDLTRERIAKYGYYDYAATSIAGKTFDLWPIPQSVIDTNKDAPIEQNAGW